jgi:hypothetical protein
MKCEECCPDFMRIGLTACEGCAGRREETPCQEQEDILSEKDTFEYIWGERSPRLKSVSAKSVGLNS